MREIVTDDEWLFIYTTGRSSNKKRERRKTMGNGMTRSNQNFYSPCSQCRTDPTISKFECTQLLKEREKRSSNREHREKIRGWICLVPSFQWILSNDLPNWLSGSGPATTSRIVLATKNRRPIVNILLLSFIFSTFDTEKLRKIFRSSRVRARQECIEAQCGRYTKLDWTDGLGCLPFVIRIVYRICIVVVSSVDISLCKIETMIGQTHPSDARVWQQISVLIDKFQ